MKPFRTYKRAYEVASRINPNPRVTPASGNPDDGYYAVSEIYIDSAGNRYWYLYGAGKTVQRQPQ